MEFQDPVFVHLPKETVLPPVRRYLLVDDRENRRIQTAQSIKQSVEAMTQSLFGTPQTRKESFLRGA